MAKVKELRNGRFTLNLSYNEMLALVSMVYLEMGDGWAKAEEQNNPDKAKAGVELHTAIQNTWRKK